MHSIPIGAHLSNDPLPQIVFTADRPVYIEMIQASASEEADVTIEWTDHSNNDEAYRLCTNRAIEETDAISTIAGNFSLDTGDTLRARASASSVVDLTIVVTVQE